MKKSESYKKLLSQLIKALGEIKNEKPNETILSFGDYSKEEILGTTYFIIRSEIEEFSDLTEEEFAKLTPDQDIEALNKILGSDLSRDIPVNLDELVEIYDEKPIGEASVQTIRRIDPQSPEQRVLRQINNIRAQQASSYVEPVESFSFPPPTPQVSEKISDLKEKANNPKEFAVYVKGEIAKNSPDLTSDAAQTATEGFLMALNSTPTLIAIYSTLSQRPALIIPNANKNLQGKVQEIYKYQIEDLRESRPVLSKAFGEDIINALIPESVLQSRDFKIVTAPTNPQEAVKINVGQIAKFVESNPQKVSLEIIENFFTAPSVTSEIKAEAVSEAPSVNAFWYSPISAPVKAVLWGGVEKLNEEDPAIATAIALAARKVKDKELRELKDVAIASGVSLQQWDLLEENLRLAKKIGWIEFLGATNISGVDPETANRLFENGQFNFSVITPTHILGGVPFNIGKSLVGNRVKGYLKNQLLKKAGEKVAASAIGKIATGLLSSLNAVAPGLGQVIAVIGGKIIGWIASKALPWIKKHLGWILGGLGALVGFPVFGVVGAVAGGVIGAAAAGAITTGTIAGGISVLSAAFVALTTAVLSAIALPLIITLVGIPIAVALILFIINSGAYIVPPGAGIGGSLTNTITGGGVSFPVSCTKEQVQLKFNNNTSSPIAKRAWIITNNLYQGFWCDWNRSPDYPKLFNVNLYAIDPNPPYPGPIQGYPEALFWCAWLVSKAYEGASVPMAQTAGVIVLRDYFLAHGKIIPPNIASGNPTDPNYVPPGSAVFMSTSNFQWGHVGVVYSVNQDGFVFVQSDAGTKDGSFTFNTNGVGVQSSNIAGFGVLK